jgi:asparagine synthase (glutamine-hydrolysing)
VPAFIRENWRKLRASHGYDLLAADFISRTHIVERLSDSQFPRRYSDATRQAIYESGVCIDQLQPSLEGVERLASYFSMEVRHPFLDRRLVEFLLSVPPDLLFRAGQQKFILRQAMAGILPEVVRNRQNKTIFSNYVGYGLRYRALGKIKVMFQAPLQIELNIVKLSKLQSLYDRYVTIGSPLDNNYIWNLISLELWLRNYSPFINGEYHGSTR